jgi:hypothetical protein
LVILVSPSRLFVFLGKTILKAGHVQSAHGPPHLGQKGFPEKVAIREVAMSVKCQQRELPLKAMPTVFYAALD